MDFSPIISNAVTMLLWLIPLLVVIGIAKSPWFKGVLGEFMVNTAIKLMLDKKHYHLLDNITLPTEDGSTQIDHIIVSRFGIFVVETKNMKGWIFGSEHQKQWTQKIFKHTARFQNPLHQNCKHTRTLSSCLNMDDSKLFPVVVFVGDSTFKTPMPENVTYAGGLIRYITSKTEPLFSDREVAEVIEHIQSGRLAPTLKNHRAHIRHVQAIKQKKAAEKSCPKCGNPMVLRTARKGIRTGTRFWGCTQYPRCQAAIRHKQPEGTF